MKTTLTKVRKIGNSRGILFPKTILDEGGIKDIVKITVKNKTITITPGEQKRKKDWSDFKIHKKVKSDFISNAFDSKDWVW
jgi:antitoxin component of MazEF toxin-antitoxin module